MNGEKRNTGDDRARKDSGVVTERAKAIKNGRPPGEAVATDTYQGGISKAAPVIGNDVYAEQMRKTLASVKGSVLGDLFAQQDGMRRTLASVNESSALAEMRRTLASVKARGVLGDLVRQQQEMRLTLASARGGFLGDLAWRPPSRCGRPATTRRAHLFSKSDSVMFWGRG